MTRTSLDDGLWAPLMLTMQQIPHAWTRDEAALRRFVRLRCGSAGRARQARLRRACLRRITSRWRDLPDNLGRWPSVYHCFRRWSVHGWWELVFQARPPALPADGLALLDSTIGKACRAASGTARSNAEAECLNRSRGGQCSKLHVCANGAGRILRLAPSQPSRSDPTE